MNNKNLTQVPKINTANTNCIHVQFNNLSAKGIPKLNEILVPATIYGKTLMCVVDTGASRSLINVEDLQKALENGHTKLENSNIQIITATGEHAEILGNSKCNINIGDHSVNVEFLVMPNTLKRTLIGMDILSTCKSTAKHIQALADSFYNRNIFIRMINTIKETASNIADKLKEMLQSIEVKSLRELTTTNVLTHKIKLTHKRPIKVKMRKIPYAYQSEFKAMIDDMLAAGIIQPSESPYSSAVRLLKKKDNTLRCTIDYRPINEITIPDAYPAANIESMFAKLAHARIFTTLDLASGYYQVKMDQQVSSIQLSLANLDFLNLIQCLWV